MFEKYGNFECVEELNEKADELMMSGDKAGLEELAKENGIDIAVAADYMDGHMPELTDYFSAAVGKLTVEAAAIKSPMPVNPIKDYLIGQCMDEGFARIVRSAGKSLEECIKVVYKKSEEECKKSGGYVADMVVFQWAEAYYTEG